MIGEHVRWRHIVDGAPARDVDGVVVACQLGSDNKYRLLVSCGARLETVEAGDMESYGEPKARRRSLLAKDEVK